jgi:hypothetical protein
MHKLATVLSHPGLYLTNKDGRHLCAACHKRLYMKPTTDYFVGGTVSCINCGLNVHFVCSTRIAGEARIFDRTCPECIETHG